MTSFNIGDVVRLKSGGPRMTVQDIGDYSAKGLKVGIYCVWFEGTKKLSSAFHPDTLEYPKAPTIGVVRTSRGSRSF